MSTYQCPVCNMHVTDSEFTNTRYGKSYSFCSQQCLDNFSAHPRLYLGSKAQKYKRVDVLKRRVFMFDAPISQEAVHSLELFLSGVMGMKSLHVFTVKVVITYNLLEASALQIEQVIEQSGVKLAASWMGRLKRSWVHYTEETELDNLAALDSACCNKAPGKY